MVFTSFEVLDLDPHRFPGFASSTMLVLRVSGQIPRLAGAMARTEGLKAILDTMRLEKGLEY